MPNYLHDFTNIINTVVTKYNGIDQAIGLKKGEDFRQTERYTEKIIEFRKKLRTTRFNSILDIFNFMEDFIDEDSLSILSVDKALHILENFKDSEKTIRSIMNKTDKNLRNSINKEILDQYDIKVSVKRGSFWGLENSDENNLLQDERKSENGPNMSYYFIDGKNTKTPHWDITLKVPIPAIRFTDSNSGIDVNVPYHVSSSIGESHPYVMISFRYAFGSFTNFFLENLDKLEKFKKDNAYFVKRLFDYNDRSISFATSASIILQGRSQDETRGINNSHPYMSSGGSWCFGSYITDIEAAFNKMDLTLLATTTYNWLTTYNEHTQPHISIDRFYQWLPNSAGTNVSSMRHTEEMATLCWDNTESTRICEARDCAFIGTCHEYEYQQLENSETDNSDSAQSSISLEEARTMLAQFCFEYAHSSSAEKVETYSNLSMMSDLLDEGVYIDMDVIKREISEESIALNDMDETTLKTLIMHFRDILQNPNNSEDENL